MEPPRALANTNSPRGSSRGPQGPVAERHPMFPRPSCGRREPSRRGVRSNSDQRASRASLARTAVRTTNSNARAGNPAGPQLRHESGHLDIGPRGMMLHPLTFSGCGSVCFRCRTGAPGCPFRRPRGSPSRAPTPAPPRCAAAGAFLCRAFRARSGRARDAQGRCRWPRPGSCR